MTGPAGPGSSRCRTARPLACERDAGSPALTIKIPLVDFVKLMADTEQALPLIRDGVMTLDGDLGVASRMAQMFGSRAVY